MITPLDQPFRYELRRDACDQASHAVRDQRHGEPPASNPRRKGRTDPGRCRAASHKRRSGVGSPRPRSVSLSLAYDGSTVAAARIEQGRGPDNANRIKVPCANARGGRPRAPCSKRRSIWTHHAGNDQHPPARGAPRPRGRPLRAANGERRQLLQGSCAEQLAQALVGRSPRSKRLEALPGIRGLKRPAGTPLAFRRCLCSCRRWSAFGGHHVVHHRRRPH